MRSVDIKVLNSRLSEYLRLAAAGETVLVTDRDRAVAEIGPPRPDWGPILADALLADAVRNGWLTPPTAPGSGPPPAPPPIMTLDQLLTELDEDRSDRTEPRYRGGSGAVGDVAPRPSSRASMSGQRRPRLA